MINRTQTSTVVLTCLNPESNNRQDYSQVGGRADEAVVCWAVAKDTSMQGGSHGDRCVMIAMEMTV